MSHDLFFKSFIATLNLCYKGKILPEKLPRLPEDDRTNLITKKFRNSLKETHNYFKTVISMFRSTVCFILTGKFILAIVTIFMSYLLKNIFSLGTVIETPEDCLVYGIIYSLLIVAMSIMKIFGSTQIDFECSKLSIRMNICMIDSVYRKLLRTTNTSNTMPNIYTIITHDIPAVCEMCVACLELAVLPVKFLLSFIILKGLIGPAVVQGMFSFMVCFFFMIGLQIANGLLRPAYLKSRDDRMKRLSSVLGECRSLRLMGWENYGFEYVAEQRNVETDYLLKRTMCDWITGTVSQCTSMITGIVIFSVYAVNLSHKTGLVKLDPAVVITTLYIISQLSGPIVNSPWLLNSVMEGYYSIIRLSQFLQYEHSHKYSNILRRSEYPVCILDASFSIDRTLILRNINISMKKKELLIIVGDSLNEKNILISALTGEIKRINNKGRCYIGFVEENKTIGYASHIPWLPNGTVKEIILMYRPLNIKKYKKICKICNLDKDFEEWQDGDDRYIDEGGYSLSGGQRARINLARALYNVGKTSDRNTEYFVLSEPFSALDPKVVLSMFYGMFGKKGLLSKHIACISLTNEIYDLIISSTGDKTLVDSLGVRKIHIAKINDGLVDVSINEVNDSASESSSDEEDSIDVHRYISPTLNKATLEQEESFGGIVGSGSYIWLLRLINMLPFVIVVCLLIIIPVLDLSSRTWLIKWGTKLQSTTVEEVVLPPSVVFWSDKLNLSSNIRDTLKNFFGNTVYHIIELKNIYYLMGYLGIAFSYILAVIISYVSLAYLNVRIAKKAHNTLLHSVINASMYLYDYASVGRFMNYFSIDLLNIDESMLYPFARLIIMSTTFLISVLLIVYIMPMTIFIIPILLLYAFKKVYVYYKASRRELQRATLLAMSPLCSKALEAYNGMFIIKAYKQKWAFKEVYQTCLDNLSKILYYKVGCEQWSFLRFQLMLQPILSILALSTIVLSAIGIYVPLFLINIQTTDQSIAIRGMALSFTLMLPSIIISICYYITGVEQRMCSIERIQHFITGSTKNNPTVVDEIKKPLLLNQYTMAGSKGSSGTIELISVQIIYKKYLVYDKAIIGTFSEDSQAVVCALNNFSATASSGECIGIIGRTGSGKSTLVSALTGLILPTKGVINIDGIQQTREQLKNIIGFLPQNGIRVFENWKARDYIDPQKKFSDESIHKFFKSMQINKVIDLLKCSNITNEECRLLMMCSLLLYSKRYRIIIVDEPPFVSGTSSSHLFSFSDFIEQIKSRNPNCTIFIIAHSYNSLLGCDRLWLLSKGILIKDVTKFVLKSQKDLLSFIEDHDDNKSTDTSSPIIEIEESDSASSASVEL